jgi:hypothetical protein
MNIEKWQAEAEQKVKELEELLKSEQITQSEFQELAADILDLEKIQGALNTEENKISAQRAIDGIKIIAGLL